MFLGILAITLYFPSEIAFHYCLVLGYFALYHTCVVLCVSDLLLCSPWIDLEQALTGLGLCPFPSGLTPSRLNDLLKVPREFSGSSGVPGLERCYRPPPRVQTETFQGIPAWALRGDRRNSGCLSFTGTTQTRGGGGRGDETVSLKSPSRVAHWRSEIRSGRSSSISQGQCGWDFRG
jgi:hypothetical protein